MMKKFIVLLLCLVLVAPVYAEVLSYTFDTDVEAFTGVSWESADPAGWSDVPTIQTTHTAGGWQVGQLKEFDFAAGGGAASQQLAMQAAANDPGAQLSFDIMVDGGSFTPGAETWHQFIIVGNSDGAAGWTQVQLTDGWHDVDDATLFTWHFDMPFADLGWEAGDTWFQIHGGSNSDGAVTVNYYMDNVVVTPEPATMVLLGLGGLLLRRKRS